MRSLERHRDVGAYALGVLDEADSFRFEDHLTECPSCAARVTGFGPAARQLGLYRRATPRSVPPFAPPAPRLVDRLLGEVAARDRATRRRRLYAVAAAVVLAVAGPGVAVSAGHGDGDDRLAVTAARGGMWAQVTAEDRHWGSDVQLQVKDAAGPQVCRLVAVGVDGSEQTVTSWTLPGGSGTPSVVRGGSGMHPAQIARFEVRTADGHPLVTLDSR
ncbi:zf-HC2 domain-containing protein [Streptomyces sp. NPDC090306]|uniref:zf-HC2 domain-containing protein n=1 Tax=Streptomyces sp. NPDC090306 TaxID=3365961 RepID=UPI00382F033E